MGELTVPSYGEKYYSLYEFISGFYSNDDLATDDERCKVYVNRVKEEDVNELLRDIDSFLKEDSSFILLICRIGECILSQQKKA